MEHAVVKHDGSTDRNVSLADTVFAADYKEPLIHQAVCAYLAGSTRRNQRAEESLCRKWRWRQAMAPEGNRSGSGRHQPQPHMARWWSGFPVR